MSNDHKLIADFSSGTFSTVVTPDGGFNEVQKTVMPFVAIKGSEMRVLGTAFAISNTGIFLTAKHVVHEALRLNSLEDYDDEVSLGVIYASNEENIDDAGTFVGGVLPITSTSFNADLDIVVLYASLPVNKETGEKLKVPCMRLSPGIPNCGTECYALGYRKMNSKFVDSKQHVYEIYQSFSASKGAVQKIHFPKRDKVMCPFPCFQINARYDGGMSGGPVADSTGGVVGVVCSQLSQEGDDPISFVSLVGPALIIQLDALNSNDEKERMFLHDFVVGNTVIADVSYESIQFTREQNSLEACFQDYGTIKGVIKE